MDVIVDCFGDLKPFLLKVGRFDTVGNIKEKIEQLQGIPIFKQTICFNNEILPDDFNVRDFGIADGSALLLIPAGQDTNAEYDRPDDENGHFVESPTDYLDGYPAGNIFRCEGVTPPQGIPNPLRTFPRRFTQRRPPSMRVVVRYNDQQTTVAVHRDEPVLVLRGRARQRGVRLPESCFFVHRQRVMEEDQSFARNHVHHGDLIEPFPGYVLSAAPHSESAIHTASTSGPSRSASSSGN